MSPSESPLVPRCSLPPQRDKGGPPAAAPRAEEVDVKMPAPPPPREPGPGGARKSPAEDTPGDPKAPPVAEGVESTAGLGAALPGGAGAADAPPQKEHRRWSARGRGQAVAPSKSELRLGAKGPAPPPPPPPITPARGACGGCCCVPAELLVPPPPPTVAAASAVCCRLRARTGRVGAGACTPGRSEPPPAPPQLPPSTAAWKPRAKGSVASEAGPTDRRLVVDGEDWRRSRA
mmetsp:Transcript_16564/g.44631  ORF Transcript_16564/g.44631 Transcript_16564/m.44631 type:complete len:233 (-) Transcript_16564:900-1598(-)